MAQWRKTYGDILDVAGWNPGRSYSVTLPTMVEKGRIKGCPWVLSGHLVEVKLLWQVIVCDNGILRFIWNCFNLHSNIIIFFSYPTTLKSIAFGTTAGYLPWYQVWLPSVNSSCRHTNSLNIELLFYSPPLHHCPQKSSFSDSLFCCLVSRLPSTFNMDPGPFMLALPSYWHHTTS